MSLAQLLGTAAALAAALALAVTVAAASASATTVEVFVDPAKGSDGGDGSPAHPLRSLPAAQAKARAAAGARAGVEVTVHLAAGALFNLAEAEQGGGGLNFTSADSGAVRWVGEGPAGARVSGAAWMPAADWTKLPSPRPPPPPPPAAATAVVATACDATDPTQQGWGYDAGTGHLTHGGLCLSAERWGSQSPLHLYGCGNASTHQNFTHGAASGAQHYTTMAPANTATLYPSALAAGVMDVHPGIQAAYIYRPSASGSQNWLLVNSSNPVLRNPDTNQCLAVRPQWQPAPTVVWAAPLPPSGQSRHLYVNGVRANRTRSEKPWSVPSTASDAGYSFADPAWCKTALSWPNPTTVEFLFHSAPWTESRVTVANVTAKGAGCQINMAQPAFYNLRHKRAQALGKGAPPVAIENDGITALQIGEFYVDLRSRTVHLAMGAAPTDVPTDVAMPVLETLFRADGLSGHSFSNIHFMHGTWLQPSGPLGYVEQQSGSIHGVNGTAEETPGNVQLKHASSLAFTGCSFTHLGAIAMDIGGGSHDNVVNDCLFEDVSAAAVQIGGYTQALAQDSTAAQQDNGNSVTNCVIRRAAVEYIGHVGLIVGYAADTIISHNYVANLTYVMTPPRPQWGK